MPELVKFGSLMGPRLASSRISAFVSGVTALNTAKAKPALEAWIAGSADAAWNEIGDSTVAGFGSDPANAGAGLRHVKARPYVFGGLVAAAYPTRPVRRIGVMANAGKTAANYAVYDTQSALGACTVGTTFTVGGAQWIQQNNVSGQGLRFTPGGTFDRVRFWWADRLAAANVIRWEGSDGTTGTITPITDNLWKNPTLTMNGACTWIEFRADTANAIGFTGIEVFNNADKSLFVRNCGWGGSRALSSGSGSSTNGWTHSSQGSINYSPQNGMLKLAQVTAGLALIDIGINDAVNGTTDAAFRTALGTMIDRCAIGSGALTDAVLMTMNPLDPASVAQATQDAFNLAITEVAASNSIPVFNVNALLGGTYAAANGAGLMYDALHPNEAGYALIAAEEMKLFQTVLAA